MINNLSDLFAHVGVDNFESLEKAIYKGTECGAWLATIGDEVSPEGVEGVKVGSIVEGSDACAETRELEFPFESKEFWDACQAVDDEASALWDEAQAESINEDNILDNR